MNNGSNSTNVFVVPVSPADWVTLFTTGMTYREYHKLVFIEFQKFLTATPIMITTIIPILQRIPQLFQFRNS